jgi:hypothetical protein
MKTFSRDGIAFQYPANWVLDVEEHADRADAADDEAGGWTVTVTSPGTAFLMVSLRPEAPHPADLADQTLAALRGEYEEFEAQTAVEPVAGQPSVGFDADFLTFDTATVCHVRALDTFAGPLLLLAQVSEYDRDVNDPVLRAIVHSLNVDAD